MSPAVNMMPSARHFVGGRTGYWPQFSLGGGPRAKALPDCVRVFSERLGEMDVQWWPPFYVTCIARRREMPLSEMNPASIQTNPHHIRLSACSVCALVLQAFLYRPTSCDSRNAVVVIATTAMSHALR
ncbi:hypothetical protein IG631_23547 [Alternaria alternata]|nr:hypothetical protein IG631_23547 [Alternaria alternata]